MNERLGEVWSDEYQGLSARRMARTTYSLGARGKDDQGELDRRVVLITAGSDVHGRDIRTEFVAWGVDPKTGLTLGWGLQYRVLGGAPDDDIEDPELWRQFFKLIDSSVWRHPAYPDRTLGAHRVFVDAGHRPDVVRDELRKRLLGEVEEHRPDIVNPYAARILPCLGRAQPRFDGFIDLSEGTRKSSRQVIRYPAAVGLHTTMIKDALYEIKQRDDALPEDTQRQLSWPVDLEARGYTPAYFKEMANEVRKLETTPQRRFKIVYDPRDGQQRLNHAWDCRVYATGAAIMHCSGRGTVGLHAGLIARAIGQARHPGRWTEDEIARLRKHLDFVGGTDYASGGDNVTPLR